MNLKSTLQKIGHHRFFKKIRLSQIDPCVICIFSRLKVLCFSLLFWKFCIVVQNDNFMLKPFSITPTLNQYGLTGVIFSQEVVRYMNDIVNFKDPSTSRGNAFRQLGKTFTESKVLIVEGNVEINPLSSDKWLKVGKKALSDFMFQGKSIHGMPLY